MASRYFEMKPLKHSLSQCASAAEVAANAAAIMFIKSKAKKWNIAFRKSIDFLK